MVRISGGGEERLPVKWHRHFTRARLLARRVSRAAFRTGALNIDLLTIALPHTLLLVHRNASAFLYVGLLFLLASFQHSHGVVQV